MSDGIHREQRGTVRLTVPSMDWNAYVHLAFDEIRLAGAGSPQVTRRLASALDDLLSITPPERRPALELQLDLLKTSVTEAVSSDHDAAFGPRSRP